VIADNQGELSSKARYFLRSLGQRAADRGDGLAHVTRAVLSWRLGAGGIKRGVELLSPLGEWSGRGEAVRYFIRRSADGSRG